MYKSRRIATVVPAYNEADRIAQVVSTIPDFVDHIIVVDDGSRDETGMAALECNDRRLTVVTAVQNHGVGGATILGYQKALELDSAIIVKMDGDGQMPPEYLPALLDPIVERGYDYAKGNRFLASESLTSMPRHRIFGNVVLTFMTKLASGYWHIFDPQNGYTAIKVDALRAIELNSIHKRFFFENDMLVHLSLLSRKVIDVSIPARYGDERSKLNPLKVAVTFPFLLLMRLLLSGLSKVHSKGFLPDRSFSDSWFASVRLGNGIWSLSLD